MDVVNIDCSTTNPVGKQSIDTVDQKEIDINVGTEKVYECDKCFEEFAKVNDLKMHEEIHTKENKCNICQRTFIHANKLRLHLRRSHPVTQPIIYDHTLTKSNCENECDICKKIFVSSYELKYHVKTIHMTMIQAVGAAEKAYECKACEEIFDKYDIETHLRIHMNRKTIESSEAKRFKCDVQSEKLYKCELCYYACTTVKLLKKHARSHKGEKLYSCIYCDKSCKYKNSWKIHERNCHKSKIENFQNDSFVIPRIVSIGTQLTETAVTEASKSQIHDECRVQEVESDLVQHNKMSTVEDTLLSTTEHDDDSTFHSVQTNVEGNFKYKSCKFNDLEKAKYVTTIQAVGATEKTYKCNTCEEIVDKYDIEAHTKIHMNRNAIENSEVSRFKCHVCNKMFQTNLDLQSHCTLHRKGKQPQRPHICDICFCAFTTVAHLEQHVKFHTKWYSSVVVNEPKH